MKSYIWLAGIVLASVIVGASLRVDREASRVDALSNTIAVDNITVKSAFISSGTASFAEGPTGVNNYTGKHWDIGDEWLLVTVPTTATQAMLYRDWYCAANVASAFTANVGTTTRPGIVEGTTQASATGYSGCAMDQAGVDFGSGTWTFEAVVGYPTLSDGTNRYASVVGFNDDGISTINPVDGCWFLYDNGNVATGGVNPTNLNKWEAFCASNSVRTRVLLDGTSQDGAGGVGAITTVDSPVAALTLPSTNIYHLKIVVTSSSAVFSINGSTVATLTTNIPTGSTRLTGVGWNILKSLGTTSRQIDVDYTRLAEDMTAARSP